MHFANLTLFNFVIVKILLPLPLALLLGRSEMKRSVYIEKEIENKIHVKNALAGCKLRPHALPYFSPCCRRVAT